MLQAGPRAPNHAATMINVSADVPAESGELAGLVREHLPELVTYATHLSGSPDAAVEFVAGGVHHAGRYPPARLIADGRAPLFRSVTRAVRPRESYPPRPARAARSL